MIIIDRHTPATTKNPGRVGAPRTVEYEGSEWDATEYFDHRLDMGDNIEQAIAWVLAAFPTSLSIDFLTHLAF